VLVVCLVLLLAGGGWTYVVGSRPGNENFVAKSADWFRDHHLDGVANWVERQWYSHHAPPVGGDPSRSIAAATVVTEHGGSGGKGGPTLPPTVASPASPTLPNEGVWQPLVSTPDGHPAIAEAQIRPDATHTSVLGGLVWIDPTRVQLLAVPGTVEPGGDHAWSERSTVASASGTQRVATSAQAKQHPRSSTASRRSSFARTALSMSVSGGVTTSWVPTSRPCAKICR
jgi:hypothetical protein